MKVLYIGGNGQISFDCVHESVRAGHRVSVFNRGNNNAGLPDAVRFITGDMNDDAAYRELAAEHYDAVCQFRVFTPAQMQRELDVWGGRTDQYVFIATASSYEKPMRTPVITEYTPRINPFWDYSQQKAECEQMLFAQSAMPFTIVRPSHTSRNRLVTALGENIVAARRMLAGKPIVVPGDGTSVWTITRSEDFASPFVKLLGNQRAVSEHVHLTSDNAYTWNAIYNANAAALGASEPALVHVPSDTLIRYRPDWRGPLWGDKANSVIFDNRKIKSIVGDFDCPTTLDAFAQKCVDAVTADGELDRPLTDDEAALDALLDRIAADQQALGA